MKASIVPGGRMVIPAKNHLQQNDNRPTKQDRRDGEAHSRPQGSNLSEGYADPRASSSLLRRRHGDR